LQRKFFQALIDLIVISHACFAAINRNVYHLFLKEGVNLEIVVPKTLILASGERLAEPPQLEDPPLHYLDLIGTNPRTYRFALLQELLDQKQPRIILLDNDPVSRLAVQLGKWAKKNESRLICISNENMPLDIASAISRRGWKAIPAAVVKRMMLQRTKKLVETVFTINRDGERLFKQEGYRNVRYMPLGFDPVYFHPDPASGLRIREELRLRDKVVAYFGRLTPEKGIHILIRALAELREYAWQLMMDSFDPASSSYHSKIKQLLEEAAIIDRVVFIHPTHTQIAAYMNAADIIVTPSVTIPTWKEQYGRVAAEAMACGKRVVASNSGALPDLLGGHGFIFEEGNVQALKDILEQLLPEAGIGALNESDIATYAKEDLSIYKQKVIMQEAFHRINP
jgi:glycosyltransferase involved in cell wall biosynthesis